MQSIRAVCGAPLRRGVHSWICMLRTERCCVGLSCRRTRVTFLLISHKPDVDLESGYIAKKPTNRAFQRYVCWTEMLSSFRIRIGNTSPSATYWHFPLWKWGTKTPKPPLSLARRGPPSNTAMPRPTARTTLNGSSDGWGTVAHVRRKVPIGYNEALQIRLQNYPFTWTDPQTPPPASSLDPSDLWCQTASGSDPPFFSQCTWQSDTRTDRPTDRQIVHGKVWWL